jgi:hypothetical protein
MMKEDKAIEQIREVRHKISEECDHDPRKLVEYYKRLQKKHEKRLYSPERERKIASGDLAKV